MHSPLRRYSLKSTAPPLGIFAKAYCTLVARFMQQCDAKTFPFPAIALGGSGLMRCKDGCSVCSISGLMLKHSCCSLT